MAENSKPVRSMRATRWSLLALALAPVLCLALFSCTMSSTGTSSASMQDTTPPDPEAGPDQNVPINVFMADDAALEAGQQTVLVVILNEVVQEEHGDQTVVVEWEFSTDDPTDDGSTVWAVPPPATIRIAVGKKMEQRRVVVGDYDQNGVMTLAACTIEGACGCPDGEKKFAAIEINPW